MDLHESRISRIEDKLDTVKEEIVTIKAKMDVHMDKIEAHIAGDKKIITEWKPVVELVPDLKEIIEQHRFDKLAREKRNKLLLTTTAVVSLFTAVGKILGFI